MSLLDARAVRKQEAFLNDRQYLQTTTARLALEDRVLSASMLQQLFMDRLLPRVLRGEKTALNEALRSFQSTIYNNSDILGFYFAPHPRNDESGVYLKDNVAAVRSFRAAPSGDEARDFARTLESAFDFSSSRPREANPFSGTVRASSRIKMAAIVEPLTSEGVFVGYFIMILDLSPFFVRYVLPMSRGSGSAAFILDSGGLVIGHKEGEFAGKIVSDLSNGDGRDLWKAWSAMKTFSGKESFVLETPSGERERKLLAWNSARVGTQRLYIGIYAPESEIYPALADLRMQRNILGGTLALLMIIGTVVFLRRREYSELRRSESAFRSIFNSVASGIAILDKSGAILSCNTMFESMSGRSLNALKLYTIFDLASFSSAGEKEEMRTALREWIPSTRGELLFFKKQTGGLDADEGPAGSDHSFWGDVSINRLDDDDKSAEGRMLAVVTDISGLKQAEERLRETAGMLEAQKQELEQVAESQSALLEMFSFFSECTTVEELFKVLTEHLFPIIPFRSQTLFIRSTREARSFDVFDPGGDVIRSGQADFLEKGKGLLGQAASSGKTCLVGDVDLDPHFIPHSPAVRSAVVAPIIHKDFLWGAIALDSAEKFAFGIRERDILSIVSSYVAVHLEELSARSELDRKISQLEFLHRMIQQIAAERDNNCLVRKIIEILVAELGFPKVEYHVHSEDGPVLLERCSLSGSPDDAGGCGAEIGAAMSSNRTVERIRDGKLVVLAAPLLFEGQHFGVLSACSGNGFSAAEREVLEITAEHMTTFWALNDLIELRRREALVDPLTQVWNRRYIMRRLDEESSRIDRTQGRGTVVLVDLGDFKQINDRYGHATGDEVLRVTSCTMSSNLRNYDMIGRYGGDEFLVYLPDVSSEEAAAIMERMERMVAGQHIQGLDDSIVLDYGIAVYPDDGSSLTDVVKIADERMYRNKSERKARTEL
jgi:diguanylate cyclase (GGDEF)-like protein